MEYHSKTCWTSAFTTINCINVAVKFLTCLSNQLHASTKEPWNNFSRNMIMSSFTKNLLIHSNSGSEWTTKMGALYEYACFFFFACKKDGLENP